MKSIAWMLAGVAACAAGGEPAGAPAAQSAPAAETARQDTIIPAGFGTLKQDQFTVSVRNGPLQVKVTPLEESVIRLAAPDTYQKLHALAASRREALGQNAGEMPLFLVSLFSNQPDVPYTAEDLQIMHQGRILRASQILPITPGWGGQRLNQQEQQMAIYAFEDPIAYDQPISVRFGMEQSEAWSRIIQVLEEERGKVRARAVSKTP